jgi:hypothetical protein
MAELLAAKAERDGAAVEEAKAHAMLLLELEAKFSAELGRRGQAFEIVNEDNDLGIGPIVVKPPEELAVKRWDMKPDETPEDRAMLVTPCVVYPDNFSAVTRGRPLIVKRCAVAVLNLAGLGQKTRSGKF